MAVELYKIHLINDDELVRAVASITVNGIAIHGIKVVERYGRLLVAMPAQRDTTGKHHDTAHPTSNILRHEINRTVIDGYYNKKDNGGKTND